MLFAAHAFVFAYLLSIGGLSLTDSSYPTSLTIPAGILVLIATLTISAILAFIATRAHNKSHPKDKLSIFQVMPPELNDNDERLTSLTAKATRNVYLFHNTALPVLAVLLIFLQPSLPIIVILIGALTMGHYIAYWVGIKPALQD
jgi:hypothetical protein